MYKWLLFDADNTLLDFSKAARNALWKTYADFGYTCTERVYRRYKEINQSVWAEFEESKISAGELRLKRFDLLFRALEQGDLSAPLFSKQFLENLVEVSELYAGVPKLLADLSGSYRLSIVTNGLREVQRPRFGRLNIASYFESIVVSDEIGVAKPHVGFFEHVHSSIPDPPAKSSILVIGDNLNSDIRGGQNFGIHTCWVSHGRKNNSDLKPNHQVNTVHELQRLLL